MGCYITSLSRKVNAKSGLGVSKGVLAKEVLAAEGGQENCRLVLLVGETSRGSRGAETTSRSAEGTSSGRPRFTTPSYAATLVAEDTFMTSS